MKVVGLNIDAGRLGVTVLQRTFGRTELLESFALTYGSDEELAELLREKAGEWAGAQIVSAVPGGSFTQRTFSLPFSDRKRIEKALPFELEEVVPFEIGDVVIDHVMLEGGGKGKEQGSRVLCLALPKTALRSHLDLLASAGVEPQAVVPSLAGLAAVVKMLPPDGAALFMLGGDACLLHEGVVRSLRTVNASSSGGLLHVLQAMETEGAERIERAALLAPDESMQAALAARGITVEQVTPGLGGKAAADVRSLGTALAAGMNFRKDEFAYRRADEGLRKKRRTVIVAGAIAAVLFAANVAVKSAIVETSYGKLDREIKDVYRKTFPEARATVDPVRAMRDKIDEAKRLYGALGSSTSALDVMKTVTEGVPKEVQVTFTDFLLEGDHLRLQGETSSFESVDKMKTDLAKSPLFSDVSVRDTRMGVNNKVKFRLEIKLKQAM